MKEQAIKEKMRLADLMAGITLEELKIKMEIEQAKARVKIMEGEEQKFREMRQIRKI